MNTRPPSSETVGLRELALVVRSKNAGPTVLTLDLFMKDAAAYQRALASPALQPDAVARLYDAPASEVSRHLLPELHAIKFSLPRAICAGTPGDGDVYGAQQHGPLLELRL